MKKILLIIQIVASLLLLLSKYFLAINDSLGWVLSIIGYLLVCFYNIKKELKIYALVVFSLTLLSIYGVYKWYIGISGLDIIDYSVIFGTITMSFWLAKKAKESKEPLWQHQTIGTILFMMGFILIGLKFPIGWAILLCGHVLNGYIYYRIEAYVFVFIQIISAYVALATFTTLPLPFV